MSTRRNEEGHTVFVCEPWAEAREVFLAGDFNGWNPGACRMGGGGQGQFRAALPLLPGDYQYRFLVDGRWQNDPTAELHVRSMRGTTNSVVRVRPAGDDLEMARHSVLYCA